MMRKLNTYLQANAIFNDLFGCVAKTESAIANPIDLFITSEATPEAPASS